MRLPKKTPAKIVGNRERFTFAPIISPTGPLKGCRPAIITKGQGSKWVNAPKKMSENVKNPSFDEKKPVSPQNKQFWTLAGDDFRKRSLNLGQWLMTDFQKRSLNLGVS